MTSHATRTPHAIPIERTCAHCDADATYVEVLLGGDAVWFVCRMHLNTPQDVNATVVKCLRVWGAAYPMTHDCTCQGKPGHSSDHWCSCGASWHYCPDCGCPGNRDVCAYCGFTLSEESP